MRIKGNEGQCQWLHIINRAKVTTVNFSLQTALKVTGNVLNSSLFLLQKNLEGKLYGLEGIYTLPPSGICSSLICGEC